MKINGKINTKSTAIGTADNLFMPMSWMGNYLSDGTDASDDKLLSYYLRVPELQAIINYRAQVFASMRPRMRNVKSGKEIENHPFLELLENPNVLQNFTEFANQASILKDIFGNGYIHNVYGLTKSRPQALWNLPSANAKIIPVKSRTIIFNQTDADKIIEKYEFEYIGGTISYEPDEIIHSNDVQINARKDLTEYLKGTSKVRALTQVCENIVTAYGARGILQGNSPMGIIANQTKDQMGTTPMKPDDKKEIQRKLQTEYGLTKKKAQFLVSNASLEFISMAVDIKKLELFKEVNEDQNAVADGFSFPIQIFQGDTTFSNIQEAKKQLYQDSTIPEATDWLAMLSKGTGLTEEDLILYPDFSHVPVLQDDLESRAKMHNSEVSALSKAFADGAITIDEYRDQLEKVGVILNAES